MSQEQYQPKIGEECEYTYNRKAWFITTPLFIGKEVFVFIDTETGREVCATHLGFDFRPIKSERDKAINRLVEVIESTKTISGNYRHIAESIYDDGFRKP